jgi:hypothetical protein
MDASLIVQQFVKNAQHSIQERFEQLKAEFEDDLEHEFGNDHLQMYIDVHHLPESVQLFYTWVKEQGFNYTRFGPMHRFTPMEDGVGLAKVFKQEMQEDTVEYQVTKLLEKLQDELKFRTLDSEVLFIHYSTKPLSVEVVEEFLSAVRVGGFSITKHLEHQWFLITIPDELKASQK